MQPQKMFATEIEDDSKRESKIRFEKAPNDIHLRLSEYARRHRYSKLIDAVWALTELGLNVAENSHLLFGIKGNARE